MPSYFSKKPSSVNSNSTLENQKFAAGLRRKRQGVNNAYAAAENADNGIISVYGGGKIHRVAYHGDRAKKDHGHCRRREKTFHICTCGSARAEKGGENGGDDEYAAQSRRMIIHRKFINGHIAFCIHARHNIDHDKQQRADDGSDERR